MHSDKTPDEPCQFRKVKMKAGLPTFLLNAGIFPNSTGTIIPLRCDPATATIAFAIII